MNTTSHPYQDSCPPVRHPLLALAGLLLACALPLAAIAQDKAATSKRLERSAITPRVPLRVITPPAVETGTWNEAQAIIDGLRDHGNAANRPQLPPVTALRGFIIGFQNGDHKLRRMGVVPGDRFTHFAFADQNGDDPFRANATFSTFTSGQVGEVAARGGGKFEIPLPGTAPHGHTLVLRGFEFRRADGTDANLRNIGVWLDPARHVARVSLVDDQGLDWRGFERTIGAALTGVSMTLPGVFEAQTAVDSARWWGQRTPELIGGYRAYDVKVLYAWIPTALVQRQGALSGTDRMRDARSRDAIDALQGFEFTFNNSDHHLLGLGLNGDDENGQAFFQDNNLDDPMQWSATFITLKPEFRR